MAVLCLCGICIPYTVLWPIVLLLLKPVFDFFRNIFGKKDATAIEVKATTTAGVDGVKTSSSESSSTSTKSRIVGVADLQSEKEFPELVGSEKVSFVRFSASWCKPCKAMEPLWESIGKKHEETNFVTIDVDEFDTLAAKYRAITIPLFVGFREGKEIGRVSGKDERLLRDFIDSHKSST